MVDHVADFMVLLVMTHHLRRDRKLAKPGENRATVVKVEIILYVYANADGEDQRGMRKRLERQQRFLLTLTPGIV